MPEPSSRPTLRRSWRLFRAFGVEQTDPDHFYGALAHDSADQVGTFADLDGAWLLDVGGGPGYFAQAFRAAGARYTPLDADLGELSGLGDPEPGTVLGSGMQLPFADESFDITYSSNVLEHVPDPWVMADDMVRVTRPGGLVFISYTLWWGPVGRPRDSTLASAGWPPSRQPLCPSPRASTQERLRHLVVRRDCGCRVALGEVEPRRRGRVVLAAVSAAVGLVGAPRAAPA